LETYYVPDKDGKLIPVFQFPFEEFERLLQQERFLRQPATPLANTFRVVRAEFDAAVDDQESEIRLRLRLGVVLHQDGWQQIPLGLNGWVLAGAVRGPESIGHTITRSDAGGLLLNVGGPANQVLEFDFTLTGRIQQFGGARQAEFSFPYATDTRFRLVIPRAEAKVRGGYVTDLQSERVGETTVVQVRELSERAVISWQIAPAEADSFPIAARAESQLRVQALGVGRWQVTALVDLNPLSPAVTDVVVALPEGSNNLTVQPSTVRWEKLANEDPRAGGAGGAGGADPATHYRLSFDAPLGETTQLQLTYFLSNDPAEGQSEARVLLRGPQFLDCAFVSGSLELLRDRELSTNWQLGGGISLSAAVRENLNATLFNLERQDFLLELANRPQAAQVRIESEYTLTMLTNQRILMTVNYRCQIQGKFTEPLWIDLEQWQYVSGGNGIQLRDQQLMVDPTAQSIGTGGELVFHCVLEKEIKDDIDVVLPRLQGAAALVQQPGRVMLVIDDPSREFRFDAETSSVVRDAAQPARFRARDVDQEIRLRGTLAFRPRRVLVDQWLQISPATTAEAAASEVVPVQQHLVLEVANQPLPGLHFLLAATVPLQQLQVQLGNELLPTKSTLLTVGGREFHAIEFPVSPERLQGKLHFIVSHLVPAQRTAEGGLETRSSDIPLLQLLTEPVSRLASLPDAAALHDFLLVQVAGFQIQTRDVRTPMAQAARFELRAEPWGLLREMEQDERGRTWAVPGPWPLNVALRAETIRAVPGETSVDSVHVRTWWAGSQRREQLVAQVRTADRQLAVSVPRDVEVRRVVIDGQSVAFSWEALEQQILVALPARRSAAADGAMDADPRGVSPIPPTNYQVEIWYQRTQAAAWWTQTSLLTPRLPNQEWCRQFTWELAVSESWLLVWASPELTWVSTTAGDGPAGESEQSPAGPATPPNLTFLGNHDPQGRGLIFISRQWFRSLTMIGLSGLVLVAWLFQWYRQAGLWLGLAVAAIGVSWLWPQLGWDMTPWAATSLVTALLVVWWEQTLPPSPATVETIDHGEHSTRTFWRDASSRRERSQASSAVGSGTGLGEPGP
jgi:hypothetical protein